MLSPHQHINAFDNDLLKELETNARLKSFSMIDFLKFYDKIFSRKNN
jgi:hypothetical protein